MTNEHVNNIPKIIDKFKTATSLYILSSGNPSLLNKWITEYKSTNKTINKIVCNLIQKHTKFILDIDMVTDQYNAKHILKYLISRAQGKPKLICACIAEIDINNNQTTIVQHNNV